MDGDDHGDEEENILKPQEQDETALTDDSGQTSPSPLPDIELDFGDDNFLIDPDQLEHLFEENSASPLEYHDEEICRNFHLVEGSSAEAFVDRDTEDLYRELAAMSLQPSSADPETRDVERSPSSPVRDDGLPPYMFCQPCTDESAFFGPFNPRLASIGEEEPQRAGQLQLNGQDALVAAAEELTAMLEQNPDAVDFFKLDEEDALIRQMDAFGEIREEAREAATPFVEAFGLMDHANEGGSTVKSKQRPCYGHRETIFGVAFSECGRFCATASQDSTICIWHVPTNQLLSQFKEHSKDYECLRVAWASEQWASHLLQRAEGFDFKHVVASSGADGIVRLWSCPHPLHRKTEWKCIYTLDHSNLSQKPSSTDDEAKEMDEGQDQDQDILGKKVEDDKPQTYVLEFIDHWQAFTKPRESEENKNSFLMTSSEDLIHFWEVVAHKSDKVVEIVENDKIRMVPDTIELKEVMSIHFDEIGNAGFGVSVCSATGSGLALPPVPSVTNSMHAQASGFGGERNPENKVYVFDASYCIANGMLGVALSDGSLRLVNGRGLCISVLNLPGCQSHLTSFCWDSTGTKLATSVATGHLITWKLDVGDIQGQGRTVATCTAIMEGGHQLGRPLFGSRYCGKEENLIVSWCVDGSLCLWDSQSNGNVYAPLAVLKSASDYPIYAVEVSKDTIAVGGGTDEGGFIGIPLYLYTFGGSPDEDAIARSPNPKRPTKSIADDETKTHEVPDKKPKTRDKEN